MKKKKIQKGDKWKWIGIKFLGISFSLIFCFPHAKPYYSSCNKESDTTEREREELLGRKAPKASIEETNPPSNGRAKGHEWASAYLTVKIFPLL